MNKSEAKKPDQRRVYPCGCKAKFRDGVAVSYLDCRSHHDKLLEREA